MSKSLTVAAIAQLVSGEIAGDGSFLVSGLNGIQEAQQGELTFVANPKYEPMIASSKASVFLVHRHVQESSKILIRVENPSYAFTLLLRHMWPEATPKSERGIHPTALIHPSVNLGQDVSIGPYVVIEEGASIGDRVVLNPFVYIGAHSKIGSDAWMYSHVSVRERITIGERVMIQQGAVIGSDGFGFVTVNGRHEKIPQVGTVIIEDDVEIGANVTIDRARFNKTVIGEGTKIDNLVHIAHNVIIGKHCLIVAQVGISGSSEIGNYVILAGQVGVVGHLTIGDGTIVMAQSGVSKSVGPKEQIFGSPAQPVKQAFRAHAHVQRLGQYVQQIKELNERIQALEKKISS